MNGSMEILSWFDVFLNWWINFTVVQWKGFKSGKLLSQTLHSVGVDAFFGKFYFILFKKYTMYFNYSDIYRISSGIHTYTPKIFSATFALYQRLQFQFSYLSLRESWGNVKGSQVFINKRFSFHWLRNRKLPFQQQNEKIK